MKVDMLFKKQKIKQETENIHRKINLKNEKILVEIFAIFYSLKNKRFDFPKAPYYYNNYNV